MKPSPTAIESQFPPAVSAALETWLFEPPTLSYLQAKVRLQKEFGLSRGTTALHHFHQRTAARRERTAGLSKYLAEAKEQAEATLASNLPPTLFLRATSLQLGALLMKVTESKDLSDETVATIKDLFGSLVAGQKELRGQAALDLDREKFVEAKRRAALADRAEQTAADTTLTAEEKDARIREIFGLH